MLSICVLYRPTFLLSVLNYAASSANYVLPAPVVYTLSVVNAFITFCHGGFVPFVSVVYAVVAVFLA